MLGELLRDVFIEKVRDQGDIVRIHTEFCRKQREVKNNCSSIGCESYLGCAKIIGIQFVSLDLTSGFTKETKLVEFSKTVEAVMVNIKRILLADTVDDVDDVLKIINQPG